MATKIVHVVRTHTPPVIDGDLTDSVWERAALVDDLHQMSPVEYSEPSEHTEIYVLYDEDALYVGARLYDTQPNLIAASNLRQNEATIASDDTFWITVDPFNQRRSGYYFGLNPNGVRSDGLYRNITEFYAPWDSIYQARAGRFDQGWTAEIEVPFKSISLDPGTDTWGINFSRYVVRKDEVMAWVSRNQLYDPSASGLAVGFEALEQGVGLDVVVSGSAVRARIPSADPVVPDSTGSDFEPSIDIVYKLTPQLNAALTINTDFSATEVDDRQVNLDRFPLFFPEKRDFFLGDADIFEFGRIGRYRDSIIPGSNALAQNGRPFFSRRIGLSSTGLPIDLLTGGKISGRIGRFELGGLSVRQDEFGPIEADSFSVLRAKAGVLKESNLGILVTEGNPSSNLANSLAGVDFQYHNTHLPGSRNLDADLWYQRSDTEGVAAHQSAFGVGLRVPSRTGVRAGIEYKELEGNFDPGLGFVSRRNVSDTSASLGYLLRLRERYLQSWLINLDVQHIDHLDDGSMQTHMLYFQPLVLRSRTADQFTVAYQQLAERLIEPFEISPGVDIRAGRYDNENWRIQLQTATHRKLAAAAGFVRYEDGAFYDGERDDRYVQLTWRPSRHYRLQLGYDYSDIELPHGRFETRLVRMGVDFVISSTLSWTNLVQYDNVTETAGINMRLHWIPEAGRELYFVVNHAAQDYDRDNDFRSMYSDMAVKVNYTFRF